MSKYTKFYVLAFVWMTLGVLHPTGYAPKEIYFFTYLPGSTLLIILSFIEYKNSKS